MPGREKLGFLRSSQLLAPVIPIFNGGLFKARTVEAEWKAQAAGQNVTDLQNHIIRDVRVTYLNTLNASQKVTLTKQMLGKAQRALDLARQRYDLGISNIVELTQAQLNYTSAQIANTTAKYDYQSQRVYLDYQAGRLR